MKKRPTPLLRPPLDRKLSLISQLDRPFRSPVVRWLARLFDCKVLIRKGQIYTVRWVGMYKHYVDGEFVGIKVEEIHRGNDDGPEGYGAADMPYRATRFRPLVKDKIGSLRKLLAPKPDAPVEPEKPAPVKKKEKV